jgi:hypothetical protein
LNLRLTPDTLREYIPAPCGKMPFSEGSPFVLFRSFAVNLVLNFTTMDTKKIMPPA